MTGDHIRTEAARILTTRQHHVWRLRTEGMPWHRVAQILGMSERTARTHHHRANRRLHHHLNNQAPDD